MTGTGWTERFIGGSREAEAQSFEPIAARVRAIQEAAAAVDGSSARRRAFHNKGDVVRLRLVLDASLAPRFRSGFLQPGAVYEGLGRFSLSQSRHAADDAFDERGFAFRLAIGPAPHDIQDVLLSNTPRSFTGDPLEFLAAGQAFTQPGRGLLAEARVLAALVPAVGLQRALAIVLQLKRDTPDRRTTFTTQRYWSRTPFRLGEAAVKIAVVPVAVGDATGIAPVTDLQAVASGRDFLSDRLREDLAAGEQWFALCVQAYVDEARTPIEDASVIWDEADAPLVRIGTIVLPRQSLTEDRLEVDTALSPWNTRDLQPLGRMNRARRIAYDASAIARGARPAERARILP